MIDKRNYPFNGREESGIASGPTDRDGVEVNNSYGGSTSQRVYSSNSQNLAGTEEKVQKVSPPRRKVIREEKSEMGNWTEKDGGGSDLLIQNTRQVNSDNQNNTNNVGNRQYDPEPPTDVNMNAILEVEEALIAPRRKEIEDTMEIVREEMKILAEGERPGSLIDNCVSQFSCAFTQSCRPGEPSSSACQVPASTKRAGENWVVHAALYMHVYNGNQCHPNNDVGTDMPSVQC
ncbi:hypothetical protein F3Y22_tig00008013pilonHSYRG00140 [Hibiscus syriacus]|uniref:Uncharacterized protein n=1 Tax=Hibiscus syriacus TaxID=106335 RepID=A0A6A3CF55_HIBSY|nr:hypothetical protein F3Y22_tig00008013pilonHSYRG00140 [Hibiscus syriacus]